MAITTDQINEAKQQGYSDNEIADYLSNNGYSDQIKEARNNGYGDDEIVGFLSQKLQTQTQQPEINNIETQPNVSKADTTWRSLLKGATLGFADEAAGVIGALGARAVRPDLFKDQSFYDVYKESRDIQRQSNLQSEQQNPKTAFISELAGSIASPANKFIFRNAKTYGDVAKSSGLLGAIQGLGKTQDATNTKQTLTDIGINAGFGVAGGIAGKAIGDKVANIGNKKPELVKADDIKALSTSFYQKAADKGGVLKPHVANEFVDEIQSIAPQTELGKLIGGDSPITKLTEKLNLFKDKPISLSAAQEVDELLGDQIDNFVDRATGGITKDGLKIQKIQNTFRKIVYNPSENDVIGGKGGFDSLKDGIRLWSAQARLRDIEKIITRAELTDNPATALKAGFRNLYSNGSRLRGFSDLEKKLIEKAAQTGVVGDMLKTFGSRLIPIGSVLTGGGLSGTALSQAGSLASRSAASKLQLQRANKVADEIANRALGRTSQQATGKTIGSIIGANLTTNAISK